MRKPSLKAKPIGLQGNLLDRSDHDYLNDNLLEGDEEDEDDESMSESPKAKYQTPSSDVGSSRLVIAIDYGTTFTGTLTLCPRVEMGSLLMYTL